MKIENSCPIWKTTITLILPFAQDYFENFGVKCPLLSSQLCNWYVSSSASCLGRGSDWRAVWDWDRSCLVVAFISFSSDTTVTNSHQNFSQKSKICQSCQHSCFILGKSQNLWNLIMFSLFQQNKMKNDRECVICHSDWIW